jgi:hypothetical protein
MQFTAILAALAIAATTATAQGGQFYAVQSYYSGDGCTGTEDGEATFNTPNLCQPIRSVLPVVKTVKLISVDAGCTGKSCSKLWFERRKLIEPVAHYYTDSKCTQGDTVGVVGNCEQANQPFVATNVICP